MADARRCGFGSHLPTPALFGAIVGDGGSSSGGSSRKRKTTIDGEEVTESSDLLGFDKTYESKSSSRKWHSTDGGKTATEE